MTDKQTNTPAEVETMSVAALTARIRARLEGDFPRVYVEGEVANWRRYPSGHCYFTLKDDEAQISAVMFSSAYEACLRKHPGIGERLHDGVRLTVGGRVTVYAARGNYQLMVLGAKVAGEGELMQRFLALKAKLAADGVFDAHKRPLPKLPRRIGVVSSEAGAVIHDMCDVVARRFPNVEIRLYPSLVQGDGAAANVMRGLAYFNALAADASSEWMPDVIVIARGGGSFEDLFCFNDEALVRAVAASEVPVVSAVGHETDFTLCDFAADVRAGTPSIAAELVVPAKTDLVRAIDALAARLASSLRGRAEERAQRTDRLTDALSAALNVAVARAQTRLDGAGGKFVPVVRLAFERMVARHAAAEKALALLSPYGVLERGYSLTTDSTGRIVRDASSVKSGDVLDTRLAVGAVRSQAL